MDTNNALEAKVEVLTRRFDLFMAKRAGLSTKIVICCDICGGGHSVAQCLIASLVVAPMEQVV